MKKQFVFVFICLISCVSFAKGGSEGDTRKTVEFLPQAGDVTLGLNMVPFFNYFGNMLNGSSNNGINMNEIGGNSILPSDGLASSNFSIFGKYFLTDRTAIRINLGIAANNQTNKYYTKDVTDDNGENQVEDAWKQIHSGFSLAAGYEWRRGYRRLQGFWGAQVMMAYYSKSNSYTYGNDMTQAHQSPSTGIPGMDPAERTLSQDLGSTFTGGFGGFVGVEYYFARKMSIGCEVSLNMLFSKGGKTEKEMEYYDRESRRVETKTTKTGAGSNGFHFGTENIGTSLFVAFTF